MRFFNTAGPVNRTDHFCLPPLERIDLEEILFLIEQKKYFVLHAPRQTGKTSCLLALAEHLNKAGRYHCLYTNLESAQAARENVRNGVMAILQGMASRARSTLDDNFIHDHWRDILDRVGEFGTLNEVLTQWARNCDKPIVLLLDEVDSLVGDTLISLLRQLRSGYDQRPAFFPQTVILCGVRDIRDYRMHLGPGKEIITGGSTFNIKDQSLRLGDFTEPEVETLLRQHTTETGQEFTPEAIAAVWRLTQGQPWLVNALAHEVTFKMKEGRDRSIPLTAEMVDQARENIILRRETHIDQLADKLQEERVRNVILPMLAGTDLAQTVSIDDIDYVTDLGLVRRGRQGLEIANPIYREIVPRQIGFISQLGLENRFQPQWFVQADGRLDFDKLLAAFQEYFREHSEHWLERFSYKEAGPQLLLQAFLQRIVNGDGRVEREYGFGRMRVDLFVAWPYGEKQQKIVVETKIIHNSLADTIDKGFVQTTKYMDTCGTREGHLVLFDKSEGKSWEKKIFRRREERNGTAIEVWGM